MKSREELYAAKARSNTIAAALLAVLVIVIMATYMTITRYRLVETQEQELVDSKVSADTTVQEPAPADKSKKDQ